MNLAISSLRPCGRWKNGSVRLRPNALLHLRLSTLSCSCWQGDVPSPRPCHTPCPLQLACHTLATDTSLSVTAYRSTWINAAIWVRASQRLISLQRVFSTKRLFIKYIMFAFGFQVKLAVKIWTCRCLSNSLPSELLPVFARSGPNRIKCRLLDDGRRKRNAHGVGWCLGALLEERGAI